jgi:hypothetical protein
MGSIQDCEMSRTQPENGGLFRNPVRGFLGIRRSRERAAHDANIRSLKGDPMAAN